MSPRRGLRWMVVVAAAVVLASMAAGMAWWGGAGSTGGGGARSAVTTDRIGDRVQTVSRGTLPEFARGGDLPELYRFATEQAAVLGYMPCTCGCGNLGHGSNRACYIKDEVGDRVTYTSHAAT